MPTVRLAPRSVSFYDPLTNLHLMISKPQAKLPADADLDNIKKGVRVGTLELVEGTLDGESTEEASEDTQKEATQEEPKEETKDTDEKPVKEMAEVEEPVEEESDFTVEELEEFTVSELKDLARDMDLSGYSSLKKDELIDLIIEA